METQTELQTRLTNRELEEHYENTPSDFVDYLRFTTPKDIRESQKKAFLAGEEYSPEYTYPELDDLEFDKKVQYEKHAITKAMLELDVLRRQGTTSESEIGLFEDFYTKRLQTIMLAEAARDLKDARTSGNWEVAEQSFTDLNIEAYGEFDTPKYQAMMSTEYSRASGFEPGSDQAQRIRSELMAYLENVKSDQEIEKPLIDDESLKRIQSVLLERFSSTLSQIPETDDSIYYDARECADIINRIFESEGKGWVCEIREDISVPGTIPAEKVLAIPADFRRNARGLRKFMIHEARDHIDRQENGESTGKLVLKKGTANYGDVEEGLGVLMECALDGSIDNNPAINRARDRYITAGLALGTDSEAPRDARQVHDVLWRILALRNSSDGNITDEDIEKAREEAYVHVENAFRGTEFWMRGMIYSKLKIYYEGLEKNAQFFMDNIDDIDGALDIAMIGKYDHTDPEERKKVKDMLGLAA